MIDTRVVEEDADSSEHREVVVVDKPAMADLTNPMQSSSRHAKEKRPGGRSAHSS